MGRVVVISPWKTKTTGQAWTSSVDAGRSSTRVITGLAGEFIGGTADTGLVVAGAERGAVARTGDRHASTIEAAKTVNARNLLAIVVLEGEV